MSALASVITPAISTFARHVTPHPHAVRSLPAAECRVPADHDEEAEGETEGDAEKGLIVI